MAVTINGVACRWGLPSDIAITETVVGTMTLQSFDISKNSDKAGVQDADGDTVCEGYFNPSDECTFEYVVSGANIAASKSAAKIPPPGTIVTVTVTAGEVGETLNSTKWTVQPSPKITYGNTAFARVTLPLQKYAAITAAAS